MRRFENQADAKFWEAWIKDDIVFCYRYGKLGSAGHTKLKKFATRDQAEAELREKLEEKLTEGFVEVGAAPPSLPGAGTSSSEGRRSAPEAAPGRTSPPETGLAAPRLALPARKPARTRAPEPSAESVQRALAEVSATAKARSWKRARTVRRACRALERFSQKDTGRHPELDSALLTALTSSALSRAQALSLLWELDASNFARALTRWKEGGAPAGIDGWQHLAERLGDAELALRLAHAELTHDRLPPAVWNRALAALLPHVEHALARAGSSRDGLASELTALGQNALARALTSAEGL
jgi:predicted DNA-binding WGR domain protein